MTDAVDALQPPAPSDLRREAQVLKEVPRLLLGLPRLRREPCGAGQPVLVVPGFRASDANMWPLRRYLRSQGYDLDEIERYVAERDQSPIRVPITAVYSLRDAVVAWGACIDRSSPDVEHIEIDTSHLGLTLSPEVYRLVARRLAAPAEAIAAAPLGLAV